MLNPMISSGPYTYFENPVGRLLEHPTGNYISVEYYQGPRQLSELQAFLSHAGQLLARWGWDKLLSPQGLMASMTPEEVEWIARFWRTKAQQRTDMLYGALLLPHDVFAQLSYKGNQPVMVPAVW